MDKQEKIFAEADIDYDNKDYEWENMPEFVQEKNDAYQKIIVSFMTKDDVKKFAELMDQRITDMTKSLWYPAKSKSDKIFVWIGNESTQ